MFGYAFYAVNDDAPWSHSIPRTISCTFAIHVAFDLMKGLSGVRKAKGTLLLLLLPISARLYSINDVRLTLCKPFPCKTGATVTVKSEEIELSE